jgi:Sulfotransferase family
MEGGILIGFPFRRPPYCEPVPYIRADVNGSHPGSSHRSERYPTPVLYHGQPPSCCWGHMDKIINVLYIAGSGRCGSTVLGSVLEQIDGFFSPGELLHFWDRGVIDQHPCGCGSPVQHCPLWGRVIQEIGAEDPQALAREMIELLYKVSRLRQLPMVVSGVGRHVLAGPLEAYVTGLSRLYSSIQRVTGVPVLVDGSKDPCHAYLLGMVPSVKLHLLHLVRDPRAVTYSWQRKRQLFPMTANQRTVYMHQHSILKSTAMWNGFNIGIEAVRTRLSPDRYLRMTYEDFAREPVAQLRRIMAFLDVPVDSFPFVRPGELLLGRNHSVSGNPSRFATGAVQLRSDDEWRRGMRSIDKRLVMLLSWPLSMRYGYI